MKRRTAWQKKKLRFGAKHPVLLGMTRKRVRSMGFGISSGVVKTGRFVAKHPIWTSFITLSGATIAALFAGKRVRAVRSE